MTWSEITQLAGIFVVFTFIVHVYQSWMMKENHKETMRVLKENHNETVRVLEGVEKSSERMHKETMRVLEENHKETMETQRYIADLIKSEGVRTREAIGSL